MKRNTDLTLPAPIAWTLALITAFLPFLIIFNPSDKWSLTGEIGIACLAIMVLVLILFIADAITSNIRNKPLWILFLLLFPSIAQIVYLILKKKIMMT